MEQLKVTESFIKFKVITKIVGSLFLAVVVSAIFVSIGMAFKATDGGPVNFSMSWFLIWTILIMLLCGLHIAYDMFWNKSFIFSISDDKIQMKGGILKTIDRMTDIKRVTDATIYQDFWGKCFHYSSIGFQTAGSYITEIVFFGVSPADANKVRELVYSKLGKNA